MCRHATSKKGAPWVEIPLSVCYRRSTMRVRDENLAASDTEIRVRPDGASSKEAGRGASIAPLHVLVIAADPDLQWRLVRSLTVSGNRVVGSSSPTGARALLKEWPVSAVLVDDGLSHKEMQEVTAMVSRIRPGTPVAQLARRHASTPDAPLTVVIDRKSIPVRDAIGKLMVRRRASASPLPPSSERLAV